MAHCAPMENKNEHAVKADGDGAHQADNTDEVVHAKRIENSRNSRVKNSGEDGP